MKKISHEKIWLLPIAIWIIVIPVIEKTKIFPNPLIGYSWYSGEEYLADVFLYYKAACVVVIGILMLVFLVWQMKAMPKKNAFLQADLKIFIPLSIYLALMLLSSLLSEYKYFCVHGMPEQFESVWVLMSYAATLFYCYYMIVYRDSVHAMVIYMYIGAALVGLICVLQFLKLDIFRLIYGSDGYTFTFEEGTVYDSFYNTNYVGYYTLLLSPLFIMFLLLTKNRIHQILSGILVIALLIAMIGAHSTTAIVIYIAIIIFATLFLLLKNSRRNKLFLIPLSGITILLVFFGIIAFPKINSYLKACDTEKKDLQNIYTLDNCVEVDYKGERLFIDMTQSEDGFAFEIFDQNQKLINLEYMESPDGYYYYGFMDDRFLDLTIAPALITKDPDLYGFALFLEDKNWCFTNQMTDDGTYYYYTDTKKLTKLTSDTPSADFTPLINKANFASGRGYIWNKTIALLKNYWLIGSGADTFSFVFPNDDVIDRYNNGYGTAIITKPHSLYLQIAVQSGLLSLLCILVFYAWYFISSLRIYFRHRLDHPLPITGFAIMLGTLGYMLSGLANDSSVTVAPLFWALTGIGIGINHKIHTAEM